MNFLDTPLSNSHLFLRSSEFTTSLNSTKSNLLFELNTPIAIHPNMDILVALESFNFTNSFYTVNNNNRYFFISYNPTGYPYITITLDKGNYDIDTLVTALNTKMQPYAFTVTYSSKTMKLTFESAENFRFVNPLSNILNAYEMMGFDDSGSTELSVTATSPYVVNLMSIQVLHVVAPNLNVAAVGVKNKTKYNILGSIHIDSAAGESQSWQNTSGFKYKVNDNVINFMNVLIYDQDFNLVDFNGIDWFLSLSFQPIYRPELRTPQYLTDDTEREGLQYEEYLRQEEDRNMLRELEYYLLNKKKSMH
jgi:hypothetical protein